MTVANSSQKYLPSSVRQVRLGAALFVFYVAMLLMLIECRPLWLDEVIQLEGTSAGGWQGLVRHVLQNAGGAPLGYLGQQWLISIAGCSIWTARFLSVVAGASSLALLVVVGTQLGLDRSTTLLGASLWAVCPLAVRYSLEDRPYMQALLFTLAAVAAQLQLGRTGKIRWALVLAACLAVAVYSQPFAVFAPLGFSMCGALLSRRGKYIALTLTAYALAGLSFIPWLLVAHSHWREAIVHSQGGFTWSTSLLALLFRECVGDGYPAAVPAVILAGVAAVAIARRPFRDPTLPLIAAVLASVILALAADAKFNYFFCHPASDLYGAVSFASGGRRGHNPVGEKALSGASRRSRDALRRCCDHQRLPAPHRPQRELESAFGPPQRGRPGRLHSVSRGRRRRSIHGVPAGDRAPGMRPRSVVAANHRAVASVHRSSRHSMGRRGPVGKRYDASVK